MGHPSLFPIHFRTLHRFPSEASVIDPVSPADLKRVFFRTGFSGIRVTFTHSPSVDYSVYDGSIELDHITVSGETVVQQDIIRTAVARGYPLIAEADPAFVNAATTQATLVAPMVSVANRPITPGSHFFATASFHGGDPEIVTDRTEPIYEPDLLQLGFLRKGRSVGLYFASVFSTNGQIAIYAPVDGLTPEEFYGFPTAESYFGGTLPAGYSTIDETDAGTLFGVALKKKGWVINGVHDTPDPGDGSAYDTGSETYTLDISVSEL